MTSRAYPTISAAKAACLRFDFSKPMLKHAELGGDGNDQSFESAFSNLAHAYLADSAPSLLDHELGFQLIDRNQENTRAVGVTAFKVGSHLLYAPVFFLQGDLKGNELLYIKNQDLFVPLDEGWLNHILNRKPNIIGEGVPRNTNQLGVRQPDLSRLSQSPWKAASAAPAWAREVMPKFAATAMQDTGKMLDEWAAAVDLKKFCKQASLGALETLVKTAQIYPGLAQALRDHHGDLAFLHGAIKEASRRATGTGSVLSPHTPARPRPRPLMGSVIADAKREHPIKSGALKVIRFDATAQMELPKGLSEEDQEKLLRDGLLLKDNRTDDDISVPYHIRTEQKLFNPDDPGLYMVLTKAGTFEKCFVATQPVGPAGRVGFATIVRLDGDRSWMNTHPSHIWCNSRIEGNEYESWMDSLPDPSELSSSGNRRLMLVGPTHRTNSTLPFKVKRTLGDERGGQVYEVDFSDTASYEYAETLLAPKKRGRAYDAAIGEFGEDPASYDKWRDGQRIHLDAKDGTKIRSSSGDVWVPEGYKLLTVEPSEEDSDSSDGIISCCSSSGSRNKPIRLGGLLDAQLEVMTKTSALKLWSDGVTMQINDQPYSQLDGFVSLVAAHGLREGTARELVKQAMQATRHGRKFECRVKYAFGDPYLAGQGPDAPGFPSPNMQGGANIMGFQGPVQGLMEENIPIPSMSAAGNEGAYRPYNETGEPMDFDTIQQALQTGQREVFDTSVISGMLKSVRDDTMIDRYIPDLVKALDRIGRILFQFYWHGDKFADRYGKMDMPELEDSLRNSFESTGDLVLFLKQKTIEPYPEEDAADLDLSEAAN